MDANEAKRRMIELADGSQVEADVYNVVEKIRNYDPNLRVKYLNMASGLHEAPYALFELCPDGIERKVFDIWELDDRVLDRLVAADTLKHNVLARMDANNALVRNDRENRYKERIAEAHDITATFLKSDKQNAWTFKNEDGKTVTIKD